MIASVYLLQAEKRKKMQLWEGLLELLCNNLNLSGPIRPFRQYQAKTFMVGHTQDVHLCNQPGWSRHSGEKGREFEMCLFYLR